MALACITTFTNFLHLLIYLFLKKWWNITYLLIFLLTCITTFTNFLHLLIYLFLKKWWNITYLLIFLLTYFSNGPIFFLKCKVCLDYIVYNISDCYREFLRLLNLLILLKKTSVSLPRSLAHMTFTKLLILFTT